MDARPSGVRGQWKAHFWVPVALDAALLDAARASFKNTSPEVEFFEAADLHVSLSRAFAAAQHEIEPLVQRAKARLSQVPSFNLIAGPRLVELPSEDGLFRYGALVVAHGKHEIDAMIDDLDEVLSSFGKLPFYSPRTPHVSVCRWLACSEKPRSEKAEWPPLDVPCLSPFKVSKVLGRAGHLEFEIFLASS